MDGKVRGGQLKAEFVVLSDSNQPLGHLVSFGSVWCRAHDSPSKEVGQACLGIGSACS